MVVIIFLMLFAWYRRSKKIIPQKPLHAMYLLQENRETCRGILSI
jgi:hypothetical protein